MKKYIISFDKLINDIQSQNAVFQSHKKTFNQNVCIIATLIIYVLITMLFYIFFTLVSFCYFSRVERSFQLTELMSLIISNLTHIEKYQQKADYMEMSISELTEVLNNSSELRSHVLQYMGRVRYKRIDVLEYDERHIARRYRGGENGRSFGI